MHDDTTDACLIRLPFVSQGITPELKNDASCIQKSLSRPTQRLDPPDPSAAKQRSRQKQGLQQTARGHSLYARAGTYATHRAAASARFSPKETDGRIGEIEKDKRVQAACTAPSRLDQLLPPSVLFGVGRTRQIGPSHPLHFCQGVRLCDEKRRLRCHAAIVHNWLFRRVCLLESS